MIFFKKIYYEVIIEWILLYIFLTFKIAYVEVDGVFAGENKRFCWNVSLLCSILKDE